MFLLTSNYDNENLTKNWSESKKSRIQPKNISMSKRKLNAFITVFHLNQVRIGVCF